MSEVTKYQYFLDNMKLIMKLKGKIDENIFNEVLEEKMIPECIEKGIHPEDIEILKDFILNLDEKSFYDECMKVYMKFSKYDEETTKATINFLHFQKLELYNLMINSL